MNCYIFDVFMYGTHATQTLHIFSDERHAAIAQAHDYLKATKDCTGFWLRRVCAA
jgi:hypothetical protein